MPSTVNALLSAWATSLILVVGGILLMEAVYTPPEHAPVAHDSAQQPQGNNTSHDTPAATAHENDAHEQPPRHEEPDTQMPDAGNTYSDLPAPGQPANNSSMVDFSEFDHVIPATALPELLEDNTIGLLPKISDDGRKPFDVYAAARPRDDTSPRIALMVTGLGMKSNITKHALANLPKAVSLAFSPYASNLNMWGEQARRSGHEVFLTIPMEPVNYPQNDPGSLSLLTSMSSRENVNMLRSSLIRLTGYVGIVNDMGSRFTAASESMSPVLDELKLRGLMFVDSKTTPYTRGATMAKAIGVPTAINNEYLDEDLAQEQIMEALDKLEKRAQAQGAAMGIGRPYPVTIEAIQTWSEGLKAKGFILVPVTAVANMQALPR
ncbi:divergent polysaccharide deacetylase family protein [Kordiimonas pumila]|uniref:Divergent polysaccharide deacetylase family protein n=1 Tax=Kordiimonas pumila TaxID=2161677 RepID=A0ABV7D6Y7_9PROT|nr:divergent polysaccharide deacetylase family protein [Kordiimonas pumila]